VVASEVEIVGEAPVVGEATQPSAVVEVAFVVAVVVVVGCTRVMVLGVMVKSFEILVRQGRGFGLLELRQPVVSEVVVAR
jgi:hypothetical protein